jgi:hypothetical protein
MIFVFLILLSLAAAYFLGAIPLVVSVGLLIIGALGVYTSGRISNFIWKKKDPDGYANRIPPTPESNIIPVWVSWINLISYGVIIYAIGTLVKQYI